AHVFRFGNIRPAFLNGDLSLQGWWYFFPYCFLVKTPFSLFALLALAVAAFLSQWRIVGNGKDASIRSRTGQYLYPTAPLLVLVGVYMAAAMASHLNIGHRHILPIYAALFVLAGFSAHYLRKPLRIEGALVGLALALSVYESFHIRPYYLAYFNAIAGGP